MPALQRWRRRCRREAGSPLRSGRRRAGRPTPTCIDSWATQAAARARARLPPGAAARVLAQRGRSLRRVLGRTDTTVPDPHRRLPQAAGATPRPRLEGRRHLRPSPGTARPLAARVAARRRPQARRRAAVAARHPGPRRMTSRRQLTRSSQQCQRHRPRRAPPPAPSPLGKTCRPRQAVPAAARRRRPARAQQAQRHRLLAAPAPRRVKT
jgi:hypothetical protein